MAEDRSDDTQYTHEDDARNVREPGSDVRDGFATEHEVRGQESDIHDDDDADDQQGAEGSELPPGLDHLRYAECRALRGVQRHENGADEIADHQRQDRPAERQREDRHRQAAGDNGQEHQVRAEPDAEEVASRSVPRVGRDRLNRIDFQASGLLAVGHGGIDLL